MLQTQLNMKKILSNIPFSVFVLLAICYLSFFKPSSTPSVEIPHLDKVVHFCMYFGFSFMVWVDLFRYKRSQPQLGWLYAFVLPIVISGVIEILQPKLTTYRGGDWYDLLANSLGALTASILMYFYLLPYLRKKL